MVDKEGHFDKLGLLTRRESEWLLGKIDVSKAYEYRLRSGIRKKLQTFAELELPLLSKSGLLNVLSNHSSYYHQKELLEPWAGFGDGNYYNDSSLGKAKVPAKACR
jgi:hypothetical protein